MHIIKRDKTKVKAKLRHPINKCGKYMFESIRLGSMDFELRFKDAVEQMSTRK